MLRTIRVIFKDSKYNYLTDINDSVSHEIVKNYFVNRRFDVGKYSVENIQVCIGIEFID